MLAIIYVYKYRVAPVAEYVGYIRMRNANTNHANRNIVICTAQHNTHEITILMLILIILQHTLI